MKKSFFYILLMVGLFLRCDKESSPIETTDCPPERRIGARCNDGTKSDATGSGACSHHGGVKYWLCK